MGLCVFSYMQIYFFVCMCVCVSVCVLFLNMCEFVPKCVYDVIYIFLVFR